FARVLGGRPIVQLGPGEDDHAVVACRNADTVVLQDAIVVVGDGEKVVSEVTVVGDHFLDRMVAVRERGVGVQVAFQNFHVQIISYPAASLPSRANPELSDSSRRGASPK